MDLSQIHIKCLDKINFSKKSITLNCGYGKGISVLEVGRKFKKFLKKKVIINFKSPRLADVAKVYVNTSKLKRLINWKPRYNNLEFMLKSAIKWEKKINSR